MSAIGAKRGEDYPLAGIASPPIGTLAAVSIDQKYRLRARSDREVIRPVDPGTVYVDAETGEEFEIVGKVLPLAPSQSSLPWSVENLRLCGCSLNQLAPKDLNDCPHCSRRMPAVDGAS